MEVGRAAKPGAVGRAALVGLAQECRECTLIDVGAFADLDVAHELAVALEESVRIVQF